MRICQLSRWLRMTVSFILTLLLISSSSIYAQTCNSTTIDSQNSGASAGVNMETDCSPCSVPPGGPDGNIGCGIIHIDVADILGSDASCSTVSLTASTGNGYTFYGGDLSSLDQCPQPIQTDIDNNETVNINFDDGNGNGILTLTICTNGTGNRSWDVSVTPIICDDGNCSTDDLLDPATCECIHKPIDLPDCDDNDCTTQDSYNSAICECENVLIDSPSCDDGKCITVDSYNVETCECVHTDIPPPNCDDNNCATTDSYNPDTCTCENIPVDTSNCDDDNCLTEDTYDDVSCSCVNTPITPPDCDDHDCTTFDTFDPTTCSCVNQTITPDSCDDGDCTTVDSYDTNTCQCVHESQGTPDCDDGDCSTVDYYDTSSCGCAHSQLPPKDCDDGKCITADVYNPETCECDHIQIDPAPCDDEDCTTTDTYNPHSCECEHTPVAPATCDDHDCTTNDVFNPHTCECENTPIDLPECDDHNCLTEDAYDPTTCDCVYTDIEAPTCDDSDCSTIDFYNPVTCMCEHTQVPDSACDDGLCYTDDMFDPSTCGCVNTPVELDCDDGDCATEDMYNYETCECEYTAVCENVETPGVIGTSAGNCGPFDPGTITSISEASGGCGTIEYIWAQSPINYPFYVDDPNTPWTLIDGTNQTTYDPGYLTTTMCYIRCSRASSCDEYIGESNIVCFTIGEATCDDNDCTTEDTLDPETCTCHHTPITEPDCNDNNCATDDIFNALTCECEYEPICVNVNGGGRIETDNIESCGPFSPGKIRSYADPSGGCGTIEYMWLTSPVNVPFTELSSTSPWQIIQGADQDCYDPGVMTQTACFIRCARSEGCDEWVGESNVICITIASDQNCDDGDCTTIDTYDPTTCDCLHTSIAPPDCDDNNCATTDFYDVSTCTCVNTETDPGCGFEIECPEDQVVTCYSDIVIADIILPESPCGGTPVATNLGIQQNGGTDGCHNASYWITYDINDGCDNLSWCVQSVVIKQDPPTIECPADRTITCFDEIVIEQPTVNVACNIPYHLSVVGPILVEGELGCMNSVYSCEYIATDDCGRTTSCIQLWTLDIAPPSLTCPADVTVNSLDEFQVEQPTLTGCTYNVDITAGDLEIIESSAEGCFGFSLYNITYTATNQCAQSETCTQEVYIEFGCGAPSITCPPNAVVTCADDIVPGAPVINAPCGESTVTNSAITLISGNGCVNSTYGVTYTVADDCENTASCQQVFTVAGSPPTLNCPYDVTLSYIDNFYPDHNIVTGGCADGAVVTNSHPVLVQDGAGCSQSVYEVTYTITDVCGDITDTCIQSIYIDSASSCGAPSIGCPADRTVSCFSDIVFETPMTSVPCNGGVVSVAGPTLVGGDGSCVGSVYECIYSVVDHCGQVASCSQLWTLHVDPPHITCPADITLTDISDYSEGSPTVTGCTYGLHIFSSPPTLVVEGTGCNGFTQYQVTYSATNACGQMDSCTQDVYVPAGSACGTPTITCPVDRTVTCFEDIVIEQATFTSPCGGSEVAVTGPTLIGSSQGCNGTIFECIYSITDDCGQQAQCSQLWTLNVEPPVIHCPADVTIHTIDDFVPGHVTLQGCEYGVTVTSGHPVLISDTCEGNKYHVEYTAVDACGRSITCTQAVYVTESSGLSPYVTIGDYIWSDLNADGIQNDGPMSIVGIDGFVVELFDANGNQAVDYNGNLVAPVTTSNGGKYAFHLIKPGDYKIKITAPAPAGSISNYNFSSANVGTDDNIDSDVTPMSGTNMAMTDVFTVVCGADDLSIDAGIIITLPVALERFTSVYNDQKQETKIEWSVVDESGVISYEVERSVGNVTSFTSIASKASANLGGAQSYTIIDNDVAPGKYYYRLKINHEDGSTIYSEIRTIHVFGLDMEEVQVYPNPAAEVIYVEVISGQTAAAIQIDIFDVVGKKMEVPMKLQERNAKQVGSIQVADLEIGNYIIRTKVGQEVYVQKISIVR